MGQRPHRLLGRGEARDDARVGGGGRVGAEPDGEHRPVGSFRRGGDATGDLRRPRRQRPHEDGHHRVDRFVIEQDAQRPLVLIRGRRRVALRPVVARARSWRVPILSDAEMLFRAVRQAGSRARFVGITGTNGKSTTTALLAHILAGAGQAGRGRRQSRAGGTGAPLLPDSGVYVLEMSSYMLERLVTLRFNAAAMLNSARINGSPRRHGRICRGETIDIDRQAAAIWPWSVSMMPTSRDAWLAAGRRDPDLRPAAGRIWAEEDAARR